MKSLRNTALFISLLLFCFIAIIVFLVPFLEFSKINIFSVFKDKFFLDSVVFGIKTSTIATLLSGFFGIPAGFFLSRNKNVFTEIMDTFFDIPVVVPPLIVGVLFLNFFNMPAIKKFYLFVFTFEGAVAVQFFISFPFTLKASKSAFELIPSIYEDIAMTLGANSVKSFFDTTFRLSLRGVSSGLILSWIRSFGEFGATLLVAGGICGKTENVPINIYTAISEGNYEKAIGASMLVILFLIFLIIFLKIFFKRNQKQPI